MNSGVVEYLRGENCLTKSANRASHIVRVGYEGTHRNMASSRGGKAFRQNTQTTWE